MPGDTCQPRQQTQRHLEIPWPRIDRNHHVDRLGGEPDLCSRIINPLAYGAGAALLLTVGLIAAYLPALRASRIEPMRAIGG